LAADRLITARRQPWGGGRLGCFSVDAFYRVGG
jgi:hypothetical protein